MSNWKVDYTIPVVGFEKKDAWVKEGFTPIPFSTGDCIISERIDGGVISMLVEDKKEGNSVKMFPVDGVMVELNLMNSVLLVKTEQKKVALFPNIKKWNLSKLPTYGEFVKSIQKKLITYDRTGV